MASSGNEKPARRVGHATPNKPVGNPKVTKAIYARINKFIFVRGRLSFLDFTGAFSCGLNEAAMFLTNPLAKLVELLIASI